MSTCMGRSGKMNVKCSNINCLACGTNISNNDSMTCYACKNAYHCQCLNITQAQFHNLSPDFLASWVCPACKNVTCRGAKSNVNTPVRNTQLLAQSEDSMNMSCDLHNLSAGSSGDSVHLQSTKPNEVTMENISALLDQKLSQSMSQLAATLKASMRQEIKDAVKYEVDSEFDKIKSELTLTTDFLSAEQMELKTKMKIDADHVKELESQNAALRADLRNLENRLSSIERQSRSFNLEIQAVPESRSENLNLLVKNLCEIVKCPITEADIRACRRVAKIYDKSPRPRNILVTLSSPLNRDKVLSAVHRFNKANPKDPLSTRHLHMSGATSRIYVVEHVSPECKQLHAAARKAAREKGYKYVWLKFGRVYLRKDDNSSCLHVKDHDFLDRL